MSRKPTIKISYPEASSKALQLTEAMVKRAPGKRVVETESEDPIFPDGGELFSSFIRCKTQTGVELTLTLNSASMDYALETLIRPNLTADERKQILGEDVEPEQTELPIPAQAAEASGQALDGSSSPDVPSAEREAATHSGEQEETGEVGKFSERALRDILNEMIDTMEKGHGTFDAVNHAVYEIIELAKAARRKLDPNGGKPIEEDPGLVDQLAVLICGAQRVTQKCTTPLKLFATDADHYIKESFDDEAEYVVTASELARVLSDVQGNFAEDPKLTLEKALEIRAKARVAFEELKKDLDALDKKDPSWDDVEAEARKIGMRVTIEPGDNTDDDIEPGLLNDIEDDEEGAEE